MSPSISRVMSFGARAPGIEHGADHDVGVLDRLRDLQARRHDEADAAREDLVEVAHPVDRPVEDRHVRAEPDRDHRGVVADDAAADHEHAARRDARHAAEQQAAPAERLLEEVRAGLRREASGDLAHRREQRQPPVVRLDGLVRDGGDAALDERVRQRLVRGDVQVREEDEPLAQPRVLARDRLLHLEQQLRVPDVVGRDDARADALVRGVGERAADAGTGLDDARRGRA